MDMRNYDRLTAVRYAWQSVGDADRTHPGVAAQYLSGMTYAGTSREGTAQWQR